VRLTLDLAPRKSLPLSFPNLSQIQNSPDGSDTSPSDRTFAHRKMYGDVGKGRPAMLLSRGGGTTDTANTHVQLLMRRSSSGAFSSSSSSDGSALGTPTKLSVPRACNICSTVFVQLTFFIMQKAD
jgi:hypothetical protein